MTTSCWMLDFCWKVWTKLPTTKLETNKPTNQIRLHFVLFRTLPDANFNCTSGTPFVSENQESPSILRFV